MKRATVEPLREAPPAPAIAMKLGDLVNAEVALDRLLEERLPATVAYHVAKLARLVKAETAYFASQREAHVRELGEEVPVTDEQRAAGATSILKVKLEHVEEFNRRLTELATVEVSIAWRPLPFEALPPISGADVLRLGPLVMEPSA